jgi:hypothetical protein
MQQAINFGWDPVAGLDSTANRPRRRRGFLARSIHPTNAELLAGGTEREALIHGPGDGFLRRSGLSRYAGVQLKACHMVYSLAYGDGKRIPSRRAEIFATFLTLVSRRSRFRLVGAQFANLNMLGPMPTG